MRICHGAAGRSLSTDVAFRKEKHAEERRHTECDATRIVSTRCIPQVNTTRFRYEASPLTKVPNGCESTKTAATRWMTYVKNPSPDAMPRMNPERKPSSSLESPRRDEEGSIKLTDKEVPKWQPLRKFASPVASKRSEQVDQNEGVCESNRPSPKKSPETSERTSRLNQRMRELYDFKTENEWPQRTAGLNLNREVAWISKSSSEEERYPPVRRNSQDLEFNDRIGSLKLKDPRPHYVNHPKDPLTVAEDERRSSEGRSSNKIKDPEDVFVEDAEERWRRFNERLRYSEDLGPQQRLKMRERRTYSDEYDEKCRVRESRSSRGELVIIAGSPRDSKRNSDASSRSRESKVSYVDVEIVKRNSRTSDASYVSITNCSKRGSVECKVSKVEIPPRRAFSQGEERPATPVPPVEMNDERYVPARLINERQNRDSTRYKVYLT